MGHPEADQCHSYGLLQWVPLNTTSAGNLSTHNEYRIRSSMTAGLCYGLFSAGDLPQPKLQSQNFPFAEVRSPSNSIVPSRSIFMATFIR